MYNYTIKSHKLIVPLNLTLGNQFKILCFFSFQDEASPASLTELCLTYVSQNVECFCVKRPDGSLCFREAVHFPQELADQLLAKMAVEGKPTQVTYSR